MLQNQCKRLKQDEEVSKSATRLFTAMTTYVNNCMNSFESNPHFPVFNIFPLFVTTNNMKSTHVQNSDVQHASSSDNANRVENHVETSQIDQALLFSNELHSDNGSL